MRYAIVRDGRVAGIVNWDGSEEHPYGNVDLCGPVPEDATVEQLMGKAWSEVKAKLTTPRESESPMNEGRSETIALEPRVPFYGERGEINVPYTLEEFQEQIQRGEVDHDNGSPSSPPMSAADLVGADKTWRAALTPYMPEDRVRESRPVDLTPPLAAKALLERAEASPQMPWFTFKAEAKRILGDDMPEKKPDIIEALRKLI